MKPMSLKLAEPYTLPKGWKRRRVKIEVGELLEINTAGAYMKIVVKLRNGGAIVDIYNKTT